MTPKGKKGEVIRCARLEMRNDIGISLNINPLQSGNGSMDCLHCAPLDKSAIDVHNLGG